MVRFGVRSPWTGLLPTSVVAATAGHDLAGMLADDERDAVATALPAGRAEFVTGRVLARRARAALGIRVGAIPVFTAAEAVAKARSSGHGGWFGIDGADIAHCPDGAFVARARRGSAFTATGRRTVERGTELTAIALADR